MGNTKHIINPLLAWLRSSGFTDMVALSVVAFEDHGNPAPRQARMEFQANRLAEAMGQGEEDPVGKVAELERSWYLTGGAPASEEALLQQRFDRARQAAK